MGFGDYAAALEMRDIIQKLVREEVDKIRPKYEMAEVVEINRLARYCTVRFSGETTPVKVNLGAIQPISSGQLVRVEGSIGDRFIADVIGPVFNPLDERLDLLEERFVSGRNLLTNPGFEADLSGWSDSESGNSEVSIELRAEHVYSGDKSIRFDFTTAGSAGKANLRSTEPIPCNPGSSYVISYRVKRYGDVPVQDLFEVISAPTSAGATYSGVNSRVQQLIPYYIPGTGYEIKSARFTPPDGHNYFSIANSSQTLTDGFASIWYDNYKIFKEEADLPEWTLLSGFLNSWSNFDNGTTRFQAAYRIENNRVMLRGLVKGGTAAANILTLPTGLGPERKESFIQSASSGVARVDIDDDAVFLYAYYSGGTNAYVSLAGIEWDARPPVVLPPSPEGDVILVTGDLGLGTPGITMMNTIGAAPADAVLLLGDLGTQDSTAAAFCTAWNSRVSHPLVWVQGSHEYPGVPGDQTSDYVTGLNGLGTGTEGVQQIADIGDNVRILTCSPHLGVSYAVGSPAHTALSNAIDSAGSRWVIIAMHMPHYSVGTHGPSGEDSRQVAYLARDKGVKLVLTGHEHVYSRIFKDGVTHVTCGLGGESLRELNYDAAIWPYVQVAHPGTSGSGYLKLDVNATRIIGTLVGNGGDSFTITR